MFKESLKYFLGACLLTGLFIHGGNENFATTVIRSISSTDAVPSIVESSAPSLEEEIGTASIENEAQEEISPEEGEEHSTAYGEIGLDPEKVREVAENIFNVGKAMTEKYSVSDGLTMSMYVLRYLAEIGEYELAAKDVVTLVRAFEKIQEEKVDIEVEKIIQQISRMKFGKKDGKFYVKVFSKDKENGIMVEINSVSEDPDSSLKEIKHVKIENGAELYFDEVDTKSEIKEVKKFIKKKVKVIGLIGNEGLNQIHPAIVTNIDHYFAQEEFPAPVMAIDYKGIYVKVDTSTVFDSIKFHFTRGFVLPGYTFRGEPIPSFVLGAKAKLLRLKISIDQ